MSDKCENCQVLLIIEEKRIQWFNQMSMGNIELHKRMCQQQELIALLKTNLKEKRTNFIKDYLTSISRSMNGLSDNELFTPLEHKLRTKLLEVEAILETYRSERQTIQNEIDENDRYYFENMSYLYGQIDYYRESMFEELYSTNKLKQYFLKKISEIAASNHHILLDTLKDETERLNKEFKARYKKSIEQSKQEIERQTQLVTKLRKHNRQLYLTINRSKKETEEKIAIMETNIKKMKLTIKKLMEKNENLLTQIKLQVEGCQNDIQDARKKIQKLKPQIQ